MKEAFERRGINPQKWVDADSIRPPSFDDVVAILEEQKEAKNPQAISLLDRIAALFELGLFPKSDDLPVPFEAMLDERLVLSLFALPTDEIKAALAELIIIRLHGVLLRRAQPRKLTRLLVLDEAWRVASSTHLENLAREGRAFGAGIAIGTQYPGDLPPDLSGALDTKIYLKNQQPDHKKAVVRALCGANSGPEAANLHGVLERLTQFEGLIQNQQYLPYSRFKLLPYFSAPGSTPVGGRRKAQQSTGARSLSRRLLMSPPRHNPGTAPPRRPRNGSPICSQTAAGMTPAASCRPGTHIAAAWPESRSKPRTRSIAPAATWASSPGSNRIRTVTTGGCQRRGKANDGRRLPDIC